MPNLGLKNKQLTPCPNKPNCVGSQGNDEDHSIDPIQFSGNPEQAKAQIINALGLLERTKTIIEENNYIHAECTSKLLRFVDDIEFYFPESDGKTTTIQVRSASRLGRKDFGVNRNRVEQLRNLIK